MPNRLVSPPKITLGITEACTVQCRHCYADCAAATKQGELTAEQWLDFLDKEIAGGVIQVYVEGGEPLLKPGIRICCVERRAVSG